MKRKKSPILVIDSGIGGLSILYKLAITNPKNDYIYFADYNAAPFGQKSATFLRKRLIENLRTLDKKYHPQGIVLACNTATAVGVSVIRRVFYDKFVVGTEPAIMPAIHDGKKNIVVLATPNTIKYSKILSKVAENTNINITYLSLPNLATLTEDNIDDLNLLKPIIKSYIAPYIHSADAVVLGCTHYIYIRPILSSILPSDVKIYDGNLGVAKQVIKKANRVGEGRIDVITNMPSRGVNLVRAWEMLLNKGDELCAE